MTKKISIVTPVLVLFLFAGSVGMAQEVADDAADGETAQADPLAGMDIPEEGPVPVPEPSEKAMQYYRTGNYWWVFNQFWSLLIPGLILFTGFSARMRNAASKLAWGNWFLTIVAFVTMYTLLTTLIDLPISYYQGFVRQHAYDLSNQSFGKWFQDWGIGLAIALILGALVTWVPYLLLKKSPKRWWIYTSALMIPFLFVLIIVKPVWIDPLYNDFGPMQNKELEQKILSLADRSGIENSRVYEVNKSEDTKAVNAYVTGFMGTKRIVLWDTIIEKLDEEELLFVMGHEMGHYVLNHLVRYVLFFSLITLLVLYTVHRVSRYLIARYRDRWGFDRLSDIASYPFIILVANVLALVIAPFLNGFTRYHEHQSDIFGIEITHSNRAAATAFIKLQHENLANPDPGMLYKLWRASHPTIAERIRFFNEYKPWETDEEMQFDHLFESPAADERAAFPVKSDS